jgi:hypothetical protein
MVPLALSLIEPVQQNFDTARTAPKQRVEFRVLPMTDQAIDDRLSNIISDRFTD